MDMEIVLSIVGVFLVVIGSINAFFLRGIFVDLNAVKVKLAEIMVRSEAKEKRISDIEDNQKEIFDRLNIVEREVLK